MVSRFVVFGPTEKKKKQKCKYGLRLTKLEY